MSAAKLLVTLVIIFVSLGLISLIYNGAKRTLREGFEKLELSPIHENELFNEAKMAFLSNQILFEEIANLCQPNVKKRA